jgi:transposase InsO family protein
MRCIPIKSSGGGVLSMKVPFRAGRGVNFAIDTCDREILSYIATTGGITSESVKDLVAESIEYRFGKVERLPHRIQWLSDNAPSYTARGTIEFAHMTGFEVCTTPYYSPESICMISLMQKLLWHYPLCGLKIII